MENSFTIAPGSIMGLFGNNSIDMNLRQTTFGMFGATASFVPRNFIWNPPGTPQKPGIMRKCQITGYEGPESEFVFCDGLLVLRDFAVTRVNK